MYGLAHCGGECVRAPQVERRPRALDSRPIPSSPRRERVQRQQWRLRAGLREHGGWIPVLLPRWLQAALEQEGLCR